MSSGRAYSTTTGRVYYFKSRAEARKKAKRMGARGRGARIVHVTIKSRTANKGSKAGMRIKRGKARKSGRGRKKKAGRPKKARKGHKAKKGRKGHRKARKSVRRHKHSAWRPTHGQEGTFFM